VEVARATLFEHELRHGCRNGSMGGLDRDQEGGPESRLWAAVVERGQEPERLDQTKKARC